MTPNHILRTPRPGATRRPELAVLEDPTGRRRRRMRVAGALLATALVAWLGILVLGGLGITPVGDLPLAGSLKPSAGPPPLTPRDRRVVRRGRSPKAARIARAAGTDAPAVTDARGRRGSTRREPAARTRTRRGGRRRGTARRPARPVAAPPSAASPPASTTTPATPVRRGHTKTTPPGRTTAPGRTTSPPPGQVDKPPHGPNATTE
jgi:hypothetical protein